MLHAAILALALHATQPVEVFVGGAGGYPVYRIPSVTRLETGAAKGRLLAFAEARSSLHDVTDNDLVMRASADGGATWTEQRVVAEIPGRSLNNPTVVELVEGVRAGRVLLMFQSYPERCGESAVVPGFEAPADAPAGAPDRICRTMLMHSDDGGATWSAPREVTRSVKRDAPVTSTATGPGIGIQLRRGDAKHRGRVLMPFNQGPFDRWRVYAAISDDGGDTWRMGACAPDDERGVANEVQMFERADGAVVPNARQHLGARDGRGVHRLRQRVAPRARHDVDLARRRGDLAREDALRAEGLCLQRAGRARRGEGRRPLRDRRIQEHRLPRGQPAVRRSDARCTLTGTRLRTSAFGPVVTASRSRAVTNSTSMRSAPASRTSSSRTSTFEPPSENQL